MAFSTQNLVSVKDFAQKWRRKRFYFLARMWVFGLLPFWGWPIVVGYHLVDGRWIGALLWFIFYPGIFGYFVGWLVVIVRFATRYPSLSVDADSWTLDVSNGQIRISDGSDYCEFSVQDIRRIWERNPEEVPEIEMPTLLTVVELENADWIPIPEGASGLRDLFGVIDECEWIEQEIVYD